MASLLEVPTVGGVVLIDERKPDLSYRLVEERARGRRKVLCITREPPERVARRHPLEDAEHYWLITQDGDRSVNPFELDRVGDLIEGFARRHPEGAVLLDGVELLMVMNTYEDVRDFLSDLQAPLRHGRVECIIPIDTRTLTTSELAELTTAFPLLREAPVAAA